MARKRDKPCAGGCGTLLWGSGKGQGRADGSPPTCLNCRPRTVRTSPPRSCPICAGPVQRRARTCSDKCAKLKSEQASTRIRPCRDCGSDVASRSLRPICADCVRERDRAKSRRRHAAGHKQSKVEGMTIYALGDRDGWRCHLCRRRVDPRIKSPDPKSPSFDHLVPVSDDGKNVRTNVRLAHRGCNSSRGVGGAVQLLLIG